MKIVFVVIHLDSLSVLHANASEVLYVVLWLQKIEFLTSVCKKKIIIVLNISQINFQTLTKRICKNELLCQVALIPIQTTMLADSIEL